MLGDDVTGVVNVIDIDTPAVMLAGYKCMCSVCLSKNLHLSSLLTLFVVSFNFHNFTFSGSESSFIGWSVPFWWENRV